MPIEKPPLPPELRASIIRLAQALARQQARIDHEAELAKDHASKGEDAVESETIPDEGKR